MTGDPSQHVSQRRESLVTAARPFVASANPTNPGNKAAGCGETSHPGRPCAPALAAPPAGASIPGRAPQGDSRVLRRPLAGDLSSYCTY